jgi:histidinol-phosphatase (PHP family)
MIYNYHTHTYRCGHATGTDEEYIERAIQCNVKYMGFSDHIPLMCDDGYESDFRIPMAQAKSYVEDLSKLKEKYKDEIDIKIGFEIEYYPEDFDKMLKNAINWGAEYLILGQHFLANENSGGRHTMFKTDYVEDLKKYVSLVVSAIKTGFITYVAHPDIFNFTGDKEEYKKEMKKICVASLEHNVPLEINFLGIFENRDYPKSMFWQIAGEVGSPVTFGFDAHAPERAFDGESLKTAKEMVDTYKLNYIGQPDIILLQKN